MARRTNKNTQLAKVIPGSLQDMADKTGKSLAETWLNAEMVVLCDGSGSMYASAREGNSRFDVLQYELAGLQQNNPGKIAVVSFSSPGEVEWQPHGRPRLYGNGTDIAGALRYALEMDGVAKIVLISDGEPDSAEEAFQVAKLFQFEIDTIYVGPPPPRDHGRDFLERLAKLTGGEHSNKFAAGENGQLEGHITHLLQSGD